MKDCACIFYGLCLHVAGDLTDFLVAAAHIIRQQEISFPRNIICYTNTVYDFFSPLFKD